ncbi:MAG: YitT family protein [Christensenellales bacterium]
MRAWIVWASGWLSKRDRIRRRLMMSLAGVGIVGVAIGVIMSTRLGMDPFGAFAMGLGLISGLSYGVMFMLIQMIFAILVLLLDRHYLNVSSLLSLLLIGPIAQAVSAFVDASFPMQGLGVRLPVLLLSLIVVCLGSSFYMTADMGVSSYDAMPIIIANKTGWPFRLVRLVSDSLCTLIGALCGAAVGLGTLMTALALGPVIDMFNRRVSLPLLYRPKRRAPPLAAPGNEAP